MKSHNGCRTLQYMKLFLFFSESNIIGEITNIISVRLIFCNTFIFYSSTNVNLKKGLGVLQMIHIKMKSPKRDR